MHVIFDYMAATRSDKVIFSHILMKQESSESLLESQIQRYHSTLTKSLLQSHIAAIGFQ